jgi:hypothetical protein
MSRVNTLENWDEGDAEEKFSNFRSVELHVNHVW